MAGSWPLLPISMSRSGRFTTKNCCIVFVCVGHALSVAFSPDGKHLVSAEGVGNLEYETTIRAWNVETGAERTIAKCIGGAGLSFSPDGTRVVATVALGPISLIVSDEEQVRSGGIKAWSVENGEELLSIDFTLPSVKDRSKAIADAGETQAVHFAYSPDGKRLAGVMGRGTVKVWDAQTGDELLDLPGGFGSIVFSRDGEKIISASTTWNVADGTVVSRRPNARPWTTCQGQRAALADLGTVTVFDIESHREVATLRGAGASAMALSPDGWRLATAASRDIRIWDTQGSQESLTLTHPTTRNSPMTNYVKNAAISPDGYRVATVIDGWTPALAKIRIWDRITGRVLVEINEDASQCMSLSFSRDGSQLAAAFYSKGTMIWNSRTGDSMHRFADEGRFATFSPDGGTIATIRAQDKQESVVLRDASTGDKTGGLDLEWYSIDRLAYHPSGQQLAVCGRRVWEQPGDWKEPDVIAICNVSDGRVIASRSGPGKHTNLDGLPSQRRIARRRCSRRRLSSRHPNTGRNHQASDGALQLAFSPDGDRLLTGGNDMVRVHDVDSRQEVLRLRGAFTGLSFDAGGNFLVAGGKDSGSPRAVAVAKVWDLRRVGSDDQVEHEAIGLVRHLASQPLTT